MKQVEQLFARVMREALLLRQPIVNEVKIFLPFFNFMKRPQTKFYAHTMSDFHVTRSTKSKFIIRSNLCCSTVFLFIYIVLTLQQQVSIWFL